MKQALVISWLGALSLAAVASLVPHADASEPKSATLDRLTVHRIDIVEPDGKPRVILSNAATEPGAIMGGKEYPHPGRPQTGGLLFFNDDGTESGGLIFGGKTANGKYQAGGMLTMDQYGQNGILHLSYDDDNGKRTVGLDVAGDHPAVSLERLIRANADVVAAKTVAERATAQKQLDAIMATDLGTFVTRVFVGRHADDARITLSDKAGVARITMQVDAAGEPTIQFFDAAGKPTKTLR